MQHITGPRAALGHDTTDGAPGATQATQASQARGGDRPAGGVPPAPGGVGKGPGSSTNRNLANFAGSMNSSLSKGINSPSGLSVLHMGFDTAEWTYRLDKQELASVLDAIVPLLGQGEQKLDGKRFVVSRIGGLTYRYLMRFPDGVEVRLPDYEYQRYGIRVKLGAKACVVEEHAEQCVIDLLSWLFLCRRSHIVESLYLVRADICMDVLIPEKEFQLLNRRVAHRSAGQQSSVVTRARELATYTEEGRYTGFTAGRDAIKLRCYDKKLEALKGKDWEFWSNVYGRGQSFEVPDGQVVARFEWQMRREFLQSFREKEDGSVILPDGITSLTVLSSVAGTVLTYLCSNWFRLAAAPTGENHERKTFPFWRRITSAFLSDKWSSFSPGLRRRLRRCVASSVARLCEMALGCLASIAAAGGHLQGQDKPLSFIDAVREVRRHIDDGEVPKWKLKAARRYSALRYTSSPFSPVGY